MGEGLWYNLKNSGRETGSLLYYNRKAKEECMLNFHKITLEDREAMTAAYRTANVPSAKYSFAGDFIWQGVYDAEVAYGDGMIFVKYQSKDMPLPVYRCPVGTGNLAAAVETLHQYTREAGIPLLLGSVFEEQKAALAAAFGERMVFAEDRDMEDYLYDREALATLAGKKYHGKRNHIARFTDKPWRYETMTPASIPACFAMHWEWCRGNNGCRGSEGEWEDTCASMKALQYFEELGLTGGILYQEERLVAYTIGEPVPGGAFAVHFEKAFPEVQGAYPMINQQFVLHETEGFRYINREEDAGDEGLRKAKLSYHPAALLVQYMGRFAEDGPVEGWPEPVTATAEAAEA